MSGKQEHYPRTGLIGTIAYLAVWVLAFGHWRYGPLLPEDAAGIVQGVIFGLSLPITLAWIWWSTQPVRRHNHVQIAAVTSVCLIFWWQLAVYTSEALALHEWRSGVANTGLWLVFLTGLAWVVWGIDQASYRYQQARKSAGEPSPHKRIWNPLDVAAWYYGRKSPGLGQSLTALLSYSFGFWMLSILLTQAGGCEESFDLPAGGGEQEQIAQQIQIQKVIRKRFVINPFSAILFNVKDIDDIKVINQELTKHAYKVGYGKGEGSGFGGTNQSAKVEFVRLEYNGGDWDQDFGIGSDVNMLVEFGTRIPGMKVAERTSSRRISQLANMNPLKAVPLVYLTGERNIDVSNDEVKILREYLLDKHGMLFGDNGGSAHFHNQFVSLMRRVLPQVDPVQIPLDDVIHRIPYPIPYLPYVAPHGGTAALGWKVDGRWVCYYHPGDIGDAWTDDHSGVSREIYESCYQLGTNVIFYAYAEHAKWREGQMKK